MSLILSIETSSKNCSVSLIKDMEVVASMESAEGYQHSEKLHPFINEVFKSANLELNNLDSLIIGDGPGSFTGLRIGASAAKGFCFSLSIPLMTYSSLANMALQVNRNLLVENAGKPYLLCSLIDARRMEVYSAVYNSEMNELFKPKPMIVNENSFENLLEKSTVYFFGDGMNKVKPLVENHSNARFIDGLLPSSLVLNEVAENLFQSKDFVDTAYYEPFYLKGVHLTTPKNKI